MLSTKYHQLRKDDVADPEKQCESITPYDGASSRLDRFKAILLGYWWLLDLTGLFVIFFLLIQLYVKPAQISRDSSTEITGDGSRFMPKFPQQIVEFQPEPQYVPENPDDWFTPKVQKAWLDLVPTGLGYIRMDHPENYSKLPIPLKDQDFVSQNLTVFSTSVTHQLHCIHSAAHVYYSHISSPSRAPPKEMVWHLRHCFDYLRQAVMCSADVALEGAATTFPPGVGGSDGWGAKHVCRDYNQVRSFLEENRANDDIWI